MMTTDNSGAMYGAIAGANARVRGARELVKRATQYANNAKEAAESWQEYAQQLEKTVIHLSASILAVESLAKQMRLEAAGEIPKNLCHVTREERNKYVDEQTKISKEQIEAVVNSPDGFNYLNPFGDLPQPE